MSKRRIVVTGVGLTTPVGIGTDLVWSNIIAGKSGIRPITHFDTTGHKVTIAGTVPDYDPVAAGMNPKDVRKMDTCIQMGVTTAMEAWQDAGIEVTEQNAPRMGVAIGSGIGGLTVIQDAQGSLVNGGPRKLSPFFIPSSIINMISGHVAINFGLKGPNIAIVTACTTGTHNIGYAARTIAYGDADVMLAGGSEKASCPLGVGGFAAARALSRRNDDPEAASRPWDKDRDGFVLGDGAGVVVLEEYEHAKRRGAKIYAELVGFGMSADAYHITLPDGDGGYRSMQNALNDAHLNASDVNYINAHGTSTPAGDVVESQSVEKLMGENANKICMSSTKSMIGHLLGAAGAVEAIFCLLAMRDQVVPATINLEEADEGCNLDYVPNEARQCPLEVTMSNSFGFGGTNGTLIFKRV